MQLGPMATPCHTTDLLHSASMPSVTSPANSAFPTATGDGNRCHVMEVAASGLGAVDGSTGLSPWLGQKWQPHRSIRLPAPDL